MIAAQASFALGCRFPCEEWLKTAEKVRSHPWNMEGAAEWLETLVANNKKGEHDGDLFPLQLVVHGREPDHDTSEPLQERAREEVAALRLPQPPPCKPVSIHVVSRPSSKKRSANPAGKCSNQQEKRVRSRPTLVELPSVNEADMELAKEQNQSDRAQPLHEQGACQHEGIAETSRGAEDQSSADANAHDAPAGSASPAVCRPGSLRGRRLPPLPETWGDSVKLGCSKCRKSVKGCTGCRSTNNVAVMVNRDGFLEWVKLDAVGEDSARG